MKSEDAMESNRVEIFEPDTCDDCGRDVDDLREAGVDGMQEYWDEGDPSVGYDGAWVPLCAECAERRFGDSSRLLHLYLTGHLLDSPDASRAPTGHQTLSGATKSEEIAMRYHPPTCKYTGSEMFLQEFRDEETGDWIEQWACFCNGGHYEPIDQL